MNTTYLAKKLCNQPKVISQYLTPGIGEKRSRFILSNNKKWINGTDIKYMFIDVPNEQKTVIRKAFQEWKALGIGLTFTEVTDRDDSLVRIGFNLNDGSWSYVGRDILTIPKSDLTMNFGWDLRDTYGLTTALHEIGHTMGFQHEHQSPFSGITWDEDAVYKEFMGPPNNWNKAGIDSNILSKIPANGLTGSQWDPNSIMEYEFGPGLIKSPEGYLNGLFPPGTLSAHDIQGVKSFYPEIAAASIPKLNLLQSAVIMVKSGEQANFIFTPDITRKYTFQTFGEMDTVMIVLEKSGTDTHYLSGDDDSGTDKNTKITLPLVKGREYLVNVRVLFAANDIKSGIIVF